MITVKIVANLESKTHLLLNLIMSTDTFSMTITEKAGHNNMWGAVNYDVCHSFKEPVQYHLNLVK